MPSRLRARIRLLLIVTFVALLLVTILRSSQQQQHNQNSQADPEPKSSFTIPIYTPGTPKADGERYTRTLVIARTLREDTRWTQKLLAHDDLTVVKYTVDDPAANLTVPANKGNEAMVYLTYIIDKYDSLDDITMFMHSHQYAWHNNELLDTDAVSVIHRLNLDKVIREGYMNLRCHHDPGCVTPKIHPSKPHRNKDHPEEPVIAAVWTQLFGDILVPSTLAQPCCGQFAVSRDRLRSIPRTQYVYFRDWLINTRYADDQSGRVWEYLWQFILIGATEHCPAESLCYCDGFGVCFGGEKEYNAYRGKKEEVKKLQNIVVQAKADDHANLVADEAYTGLNNGVNIEKLQKQISDGRDWLRKTEEEALERGNDPAARRREIEKAAPG